MNLDRVEEIAGVLLDLEEQLPEFEWEFGQVGGQMAYIQLPEFEWEFRQDGGQMAYHSGLENFDEGIRITVEESDSKHGQFCASVEVRRQTNDRMSAQGWHDEAASSVEIALDELVQKLTGLLKLVQGDGDER